MSNEERKGFVLDFLNSVFSWFDKNEKAGMWVVIVILGFLLLDAKDDLRTVQVDMYEKLLKDLDRGLDKKIAPLEARQDSVVATVDTTTGKIQSLIKRIDKKLSE